MKKTQVKFNKIDFLKYFAYGNEKMLKKKTVSSIIPMVISNENMNTYS
jgi:hypothetical protein